MTLLGVLWRVLNAVDGVIAELHFLPAVAARGVHRRQLAEITRNTILAQLGAGGASAD